jgi:hypothetical protein
MHIRPAYAIDAPAIWRVIGPTNRAGETDALGPEMTEADALAYWVGAGREKLVAEDFREIVATYYLRANQAGGWRYVRNCGYMAGAAAIAAQ